MTSLVSVELFVMVITISGSAAELLFLYRSLNPKIIPYVEFAGGKCQDAPTLVELSGVRLKLVGASLGPKSSNARISKNAVALYYNCKNKQNKNVFIPN